MCLAKAYIRSQTDDPGATLAMENVTHVEVDGDQIRMRSLFGDASVVRGRIASIDFAENRLVLESVDA
jgi:predicted RNA-binding protein